MNKKDEFINIINSGISLEDKKNIPMYLEMLAYKQSQIKEKMNDDYIKIRSNVNLICMATTLNYSFSTNELKFYSQDKENFSITIKPGKVNYCKKTGFNLLYFEIIEKYKKNLGEIAIHYKKIKPYLEQLKEIENKKRILIGQNIYDACIEEKKYDSELRKYLKINKNKIEKLKEKIFDNTGWYYLENDQFGMVDVDGNVINAVTLKDKWRPYSEDNSKKKTEESFILENMESLNNYKIERNILRSKLVVKEELENRIKKEVNNRFNLIEELKREENKEKIKQKVI